MYKRYKYVVSIYGGGGVLVVIAKKGYDEGGRGRGPATASHISYLHLFTHEKGWPTKIYRSLLFTNI